jgi:putative flippase GtrA
MRRLTAQQQVMCRQWFRYLAVGVSNTVISFGLYVLLVDLGIHYLAAAVVSSAVAIANSYVLNRRWTFRSTEAHLSALTRFCVTQCGGMALDLGLLYSLVRVVELPRVPSQALAILAVSVATFLVNRRWTFAPTAGA